MRACPIPEPIYFPSGNRSLFGWLHATPGQSGSLGLVVCKPFGFEAMSAHLSVRAFAEAAAQAGIPAIRFDYGGTGDSEDLEPAADQMSAWLDDVKQAVEELQRRTRVERVCLLGIRFGALLAALAVSHLPQVQSVIFIVPVINGRRYLREMRTFELAAAQTQTVNAPREAEVQSAEAQAAGDGHMEVSGFFINAKTMAALQQVDLLTVDLSTLTDSLLIDREDLPGAAALRERLSAGGVHTEYLSLPGFVEMIMRPPNLTATPQSMVTAVHRWLSSHVAPPVRTGDSNAGLRSAGPASVMHLRSVQANIAEHPVLLRADPLLFGIVTSPPDGEARRRAVVLLNSGGDHHIGPRRLHVSLAREWSKRGYFVLRLDLSGLGDSTEQPGQPRNALFPTNAIDDIRIAVEFMRSKYAVRDVTLLGICSGASHAVRAGMEGVPIDAVLAVNPLVFFWEDSINVDDVQPWEILHKPTAYLGKIGSLDAWRRLLFGDVSIWRVAQIYFHRPLMAARAQLRNIARGAHIPLKDDLGLELKDLKARGVRIAFVFSRGDAGMRLLQIQSGLSAKQLGERYSVRTIDGADHSFTRSRARAALGLVLSEELFGSYSNTHRPAANDGSANEITDQPSVSV